MPSLSNLQVIFLGIISTELMLFFVLDGADFGAGMATFFVGDDLSQRQQIMKVTGPVWGGNETWAVTAFAVMFAAYPGWYSALTSGYYPLFFLMLFFLIFRGVAFDYRNQWHSRHYNRFWDWALFIGSLIPPFLLGIIFSSTVSGVPIRNGFVYASMGDILTPFTLLGGILAVLLSLNVGLTRVIKKVKVDVAEQLTVALKRTTWALYAAVALFVALLPFYTRFFTNRPILISFLLILLVAFLGVESWAIANQHQRVAFWLSVGTMASFIYTIFLSVFPTLIVGRTRGTSVTALTATSGPVSLLWTAWLFGFTINLMVGLQATAYHLINKYYHEPASPMI
ncbi:cytochrome d ubiquinol oxidase subunit II [Lacticaseibacillus chiayiensis]|uniref:Cytochrome d ubiquinol oxidase subunit II n=1 Tax=Lacticaseibacillus chiayiensis TaxID=2100821 RepID=A0A4Q1TWH6_9LACO|nr:cytochrome d ubiquinol oxidase subunit II [Lacticaseibacillus chiayiensis]QVI34790.1 cytochrome d ubiquinol oxidase subunit II [Lacticaseibacillus chiayiensis]RXT22648.1 cytochrome d ubiquinol oxidase subunit II [Lacticaseibacillus chiayiensis]UYN56544.1 cytochrome d ubiquinol oxidase subunit II [Lacticaseibacillus chiayiensis]